MGELKPCPCGAKAKLLETDGLSESYGVFNDVMYSKVICQQCSFSADDVEDWNNRAPQSQWVSVDDRLPDESHAHVYVHCKGGNMTRSYFIKDREAAKDYFSGNGGYSRKSQGKYSAHFQVAWSGYKITHWMPLPTPPKDIDCENNSRSKRA